MEEVMVEVHQDKREKKNGRVGIKRRKDGRGERDENWK